MSGEQQRITAPVPLLDEAGRLVKPGYATHMLYRYNRHRVAGRPFGLKEWDFYQLALGDYVLQLTIGHVSYMSSVSGTLFSLTSGERRSFTHMEPLPLRGMAMPLSPERPSVLRAEGRDYAMEFAVTKTARRLRLRAERGADSIDVDLLLPQNPSDEKMVIATPFEHPEQFYLNCKEHYYGVTGHARFGDLLVRATGQETGLLDWGRGVWPFHQEWFWGCGSAFVPGGRFGFNIGWGFGNLEHATENMFFWNGTAHKLGVLTVERDPADYLAPWRFYTEDDRFDLTMQPVFDNYTETKLAFVNNQCHQVFGSFSGKAVLPNGQTLQLEELTAFCEHATNNW